MQRFEIQAGLARHQTNQTLSLLGTTHAVTAGDDPLLLLLGRQQLASKEDRITRLDDLTPPGGSGFSN